MEVIKDHSAKEYTPVAGPGTLNSLLRVTVFGVAMIINTGCNTMMQPHTQGISVVKPARKSILGETITIEREGLPPVTFCARLVEGVLQIETGGKIFVIEELPIPLDEPVGRSITNVEMDDQFVYITSSYADVIATRSEAQRGIEKMETSNGGIVPIDISVIIHSKSDMLSGALAVQRMWSQKKAGDWESFTVSLAEKKNEAIAQTQSNR